MKERLDKFIKSEGLTPSRFAEIMSVQPSSISHILGGRNKPSFDFLEKMLLRFPKLNPDWLLLGKGQIYRTLESPTTAQDELSRNPSISSSTLFGGAHSISTPTSAVGEASLFTESANLPQNAQVLGSENIGAQQDRKAEVFAQPNTSAQTQPSESALFQSVQGNSPKEPNLNDSPTVNSGQQSRSSATQRANSQPLTSNTTKSHLPLELFAESDVERIVLFYSDQSYSVYYPRNKRS